MDRNTRTLKIEDKTINFYEYYITNALILKFVDTDINKIKDFFGTKILTGFDEIDAETGETIASESFYFKRKSIFVENEIIIERENKVIREPWDEEVIDEETGDKTIIHHDAEIEVIENKFDVEMTTVTFESPTIGEEVLEIRDELVTVKESIENLETGIDLPDKALIEASILVAKSNAQTLDDDSALLVKVLYPTWDELVKLNFVAKNAEYKFTYNDVLYKTINPNQSFQEQWVPGQGTESIFIRIDESHAGTQEDPIPYHVNMEVFEGKYYIEDDVLYKCTRSSGQALHNKASELVGHYFEVVK